MMKAEPSLKVKKVYTEVRDTYGLLLEKQEYVHLLENICNLSIQEVLEKGENYCQRNEFSRAQAIYIKGLKNNP